MRAKILAAAGLVYLVSYLFSGGSEGETILTLGIITMMLVLWISDVIPVATTALVPLVFFPIHGILSYSELASCYAKDMIFLFMGGFFLAVAFQKWDLHKRLALLVLSKVGMSPLRLVAGLMISTAFLSMWISNTATTILMIQIGAAIFSGVANSFGEDIKKLKLAGFLGIAFSANIGGMATLIGTPPNGVMVSFLNESGMEVDFAEWFFFAFPLTILLNLVLLFVLNYAFIRKIVPLNEVDKSVVRDELKAMGKLNFQERGTLIIFITTAVLWITRSLYNEWFDLHIKDATIALGATLALFVVGNKNGTLLKWDDSKNVEWGILLLFGGGFSIAKALDKVGVVETLVDYIQGFGIESLYIWLLILVALCIFMTELMSNLALATVLIPIAIHLANEMSFDARTLAYGVGLAASCAFMFPIATPPNAIAYATGEIKMKEMMRVGLVLNLLCVIIIATYTYLVL